MESEVGKLIKQRRGILGLTLSQLNARCGVSIAHLGRIERGERFPSARVLQKIARALGFNEIELFCLAGYLSPTQETATTGKLDPYVASVLATESPEVQRIVVSILLILRNLQKSNGR